MAPRGVRLYPIGEVATLFQLAEADDADVRNDATQRIGDFDRMRVASGVIVFHDGDALLTGEPAVQFGRPLAFALAAGIGGGNEAQPRRGLGVFLAGGDHHPGVSRSIEQLGQPIGDF